MAKEEGKTEEPGKDNKKLYIIIGAAVAAVIVIAIVLVVLLGGKKEKGKEGEHGAKTEQKAEGGHGGGSGEGGAAAVYPLEPFIVNIYDGQEIRYLKVKVEFGTSGPDAKAELDARQAPLRDAILVLLTTKTLQDVQDLQGKNQLRDEILTAVNKIAPPGKVTKVYFTDFVVQ